MKSLLLFTLSMSALITSSCVFSGMEKGLAELKGKPIDTAINVLGYPDRQQAIGADKVYIWSRSFQGSYSVPQVASTTGYIGNTPVYGTTTYNTTQTANYSCIIKLGADSKGIIKRWEYSGNRRGCGGYSQSLKRYYKSQHPE